MPPTQKQQNERAAERAEREAADRSTEQPDAGQQARAAAESDERGRAGDASVPASATTVGADVHVIEGASAKFSTTAADVDVDPRTGQAFGAGQANAGLKGTHGEELLSDEVGIVVPGVDPKRIPAEVTPGVTPDAGGDRLLAAAQAKAPSLTKEFVEKMGLTDVNLAEIAQGLVPPPPTPGPIHTADMYRTPGGYQQTPPGVPPEDVGGNQIHRA
jgi:hypothetical protein